MLMLMLMQQAVQEKYRLACENLDSFNSWLDKIEKEISSQESLADDVHQLKSQMKVVKVTKDIHYCYANLY